MPRPSAPIPFAVALALILASVFGPVPPPFESKVVAVADGDTLTVLRDDKTTVRVRLHGVDAPESGRDRGDKTRRGLVELRVGGQEDGPGEPTDVDRTGGRWPLCGPGTSTSGRAGSARAWPGGSGGMPPAILF